MGERFPIPSKRVYSSFNLINMENNFFMIEHGDIRMGHNLHI